MPVWGVLSEMQIGKFGEIWSKFSCFWTWNSFAKVDDVFALCRTLPKSVQTTAIYVLRGKSAIPLLFQSSVRQTFAELLAAGFSTISGELYEWNGTRILCDPGRTQNRLMCAVSRHSRINYRINLPPLQSYIPGKWNGKTFRDVCHFPQKMNRNMCAFSVSPQPLECCALLMDNPHTMCSCLTIASTQRGQNKFALGIQKFDGKILCWRLRPGSNLSLR